MYKVFGLKRPDTRKFSRAEINFLFQHCVIKIVYNSNYSAFVNAYLRNAYIYFTRATLSLMTFILNFPTAQLYQTSLNTAASARYISRKPKFRKCARRIHTTNGFLKSLYQILACSRR